MILSGGLLGFLLFFTLNVSAYWRMPCMGVVGRGQIDPIVAPGKIAAHLHSIKGASGISINSSVEELLASDCTSCQISQDKSAYWSPQMYFYDTAANKYEMVEEVSGHLSYYKFVPHTIADGTYKMPIAIPNGMKMLSGDPFRRNFTLPVPDPPLPWSGDDATQDALRQKAIGFNCLNYKGTPEGTLQRHFLPDKNFLETQCPDGIRLEVLFPTCWNGVDLESEDLTSHLAYGTAGANGGSCPKGYDTVIMQLLFETIYPTTGYLGRAGYFVFAQGDPTGYGYHGDALIAWEGTTLEDAVRDCGDPDPAHGKQATDGVVEHCSHFSTVARDDQSSCAMQATSLAVKYVVKAQATALPGNNPVQFGPERATQGGSNAVVTPVTELPSNIVPTSQSVAARTSDPSNPYANQFKQVASTSTDSSSSAERTPSPVVAVQAPETTPAPAVQVNGNRLADEQVLNTVTYTSNGAVYEIVNVEVFSTTTVYEGAKAKRHVLKHRHHARNSHH